MLKIHNSTKLHIPKVYRSKAALALSPIASDKDELIQAIENEAHADEWQLTDQDANSLAQFWSGVQDDIAHDPEWFTFAND